MSSSVPQPVTFISFPKLPTELRLMIWELALDQPRHTVHVYPVEDDRSPNGPEPKPVGRATLNFILEREYALCMRHNSETTSEYEESGKDRGMWRACKESREIVMKNTKGPFKSHFGNPLTTRLTNVLNADIIHLVRVPYLLDEIVTMGIKPGQALTEKVDRAIKSENVFIIDIKRPLHRMSVRLAVWRFAHWFGPLGRVFLVDNSLKRSRPIEPGATVPDVIFEEDGRRFVKVRIDGAGWVKNVPGQGNQRVRYRYHSRFHIAACECV
ncbi:tetracycline resistance [Fusarium mundagurra]|uniref:Tetracycline resistance n=1 Tax=Fusarium mundagurra TaxID=1567541 RepID=A0A8H5Z738_9HYPO|nr:tetracycline resistance [Fusarium mundagurra]